MSPERVQLTSAYLIGAVEACELLQQYHCACGLHSCLLTLIDNRDQLSPLIMLMSLSRTLSAVKSTGTALVCLMILFLCR